MPAIVLRPRPSRRLLVWWVALHLLLAAAALLVAAPGWAKLLLLGVVAAHGLRRRPGRPPERVELGADGLWVCPGLGPEPLRLGPKSRFARGWVRLVDRSGAPDLLLLEDQLEAAEWARLSALLRRMTLDAPVPPSRSLGPRPPDLR